MSQLQVGLKRHSVASKVFLVGEYLAAAGGPALVATVAPRFELVEGGVPRRDAHRFHPGSPAGKLLECFKRQRPSAITDYHFVDPHEGRGGFGASSAEFAALYHALSPMTGWRSGWREVWNLFRELTADTLGLRPSGADVVAQWRGGVTWIDTQDATCIDLTALLDGSRVMVFSANRLRKVATHDHLSRALSRRGGGSLNWLPLSELAGIVAAAVSAIRARDISELGRAFHGYAGVLQRIGLEHVDARGDREALASLPGVVAAKGCGALLADAVVVLVDEAVGRSWVGRRTVIDAAQRRGLELVADGLTAEMGVCSHA